MIVSMTLMTNSRAEIAFFLLPMKLLSWSNPVEYNVCINFRKRMVWLRRMVNRFDLFQKRNWEALLLSTQLGRRLMALLIVLHYVIFQHPDWLVYSPHLYQLLNTLKTWCLYSVGCFNILFAIKWADESSIPCRSGVISSAITRSRLCLAARFACKHIYPRHFLRIAFLTSHSGVVRVRILALLRNWKVS